MAWLGGAWQGSDGLGMARVRTDGERLSGGKLGGLSLFRRAMANQRWAGLLGV
jgi:hypothetical protein